MSRHERTISMIGQEAMEKLAGAKVLVFGVGGVGGYVCEALHVQVWDISLFAITMWFPRAISTDRSLLLTIPLDCLKPM